MSVAEAKGAAPVVMAIGAHPDDIEFYMAGTMILLQEAGWEAHYLNIANGDCGTMTEPRDRNAAIRREEAKEACAFIGATFHESFTGDLHIEHSNTLIAKTAAAIRKANPRILLTHSPSDYMADHENACKVAVTAAFAKNMPNLAADPDTPPAEGDICIYHAMPHGLRDPLRRVVRPGQYVDVTSVLEKKREMLAKHRSQKEWLDATQGFDSYLATMENFSRQVGGMSGRFEAAEGWRRHLHLGYAASEFDPLTEALGGLCLIDEIYERELGELPPL